MHAAIRQAVRSGALRSAHDVAEGGLAVALAECCVASGMGADVTLEDAERGAAVRRGPGRVRRLRPARGVRGVRRRRAGDRRRRRRRAADRRRCSTSRSSSSRRSTATVSPRCSADATLRADDPRTPRRRRAGPARRGARGRRPAGGLDLPPQGRLPPLGVQVARQGRPLPGADGDLGHRRRDRVRHRHLGGDHARRQQGDGQRASEHGVERRVDLHHAQGRARGRPRVGAGRLLRPDAAVERRRARRRLTRCDIR